MADLKGLYRDLILDHYRKPRNFHKLEHSNRQADGLNPLCGDKLSVYLQIENGIVQDIAFAGTGCAISIAAASMMTESLKGKTEAEAKTLHDNFLLLVDNRSENQPDLDVMGDLAVFSSVRQFPVRARCATLAWNAVRAAIEQRPERGSME
jgi:nitrogen fixation NifU-like protein